MAAVSSTKDDYPQQLYNYTQESCHKEEAFHILEFEFLQRLNIAQLQNKLAEIKSTAIHNYSTLRSLPTLPFPHREERNMRLERHFPSLTRLPNRPFGSHYYYATPPTFHPGHDSIRNFFRLHLPRSLIYSAEEKQARKYEYESSQHPIEVSLTVDRLARFVVAFTGGAFLVVPMLVMVFAPSTVKSVSTVSAAVVLFAVATAFGVRAGNVETLVATATYAAVLMVFVGTSS
ncbi:hypothetical protein MMC34_001337 [Xylographa carneopallida]|nr:hypothetical protein [Xylographa carneopallida]